MPNFSAADAVYLGATEVTAAHLGAIEVYSAAPAPAGPFTGYIVTATPGSPKANEVVIHDILEAEGHTVGYHDITNAGSVPGDAEFLIQPDNDTWDNGYPMWTVTLPFMSMAKNNIYVQGMLPWSDTQSEGARFDGTGLWGQTVRFTDDTIISWSGQSSPSTVDILDSDQWTNGAVSKVAIDSQTGNDAQHFLSIGNDTDDSHSAGFYLPTGSTVTEPDNNENDEVVRTSTAPFIGLFWDATFTNNLNADGEALVVACFDKLMS